MVEGWISEIEGAFKGKRVLIEKAVGTLLARGHLLIEDVPGVGKTTLARAIAQSTDLMYKRIQFTPDLMPTDVTGGSLFDFKLQEFKVIKGPVFTQVLLIDEINRGTPKTQSALLEAMQENQVTLEGEHHPLPSPFFVIATQNPFAFEGTFPLPEAQIDRFLTRLTIGYPIFEDEISILKGHDQKERMPIVNASHLMQWQNEVQMVHVEQALMTYAIHVVEKSRVDHRVKMGISPRGTKGWIDLSKAWAWLKGRDYVIPEDMIQVSNDVLAHRLQLNTEARFRGDNTAQLIQEWLHQTAIPRSR